MQNSSAFQNLAIDTIHESATNPRRTFDEIKLQEFAAYVPRHISGFMFRTPLCAPQNAHRPQPCGFSPHRPHNGVRNIRPRASSITDSSSPSPFAQFLKALS
jgi:hypothetical protein